MSLRNNANATNSKTFDWFIGSNGLEFRLISDDLNTYTNYMRVRRSGMTIDTLEVPKLDVQGTLKVYTHAIASDADSALVWDRSTNAYKVAKISRDYISGTYTPTLTNILNISASTAYVCQYMQIGNVVTVSGKFDVDPTSASSLVRLGISLPASTNFTADHQAGGTATNVTVLGYTGPIFADATNDRLEFAIDIGTTDTNLSYYFTVTYLIDNS